MTDRTNPTDLTVMGHMVNGDLASISMQVSYHEATGKSDHIDYDQKGNLFVNGQQVQPPLTTENGTRISGGGRDITIETNGGDRFTFRAPDCGIAGINMDGDVAANRGEGNVDSHFFGKFDDRPAGTEEMKDTGHTVDVGSAARGYSGGGTTGAVSGASGATGGSAPVLVDPYKEIREAFSKLATSDGPPPAAAAAFLTRVATPDLSKAIVANAKAGGEIDPGQALNAIHSVDDQAAIRRAISNGKATLEDMVKFIHSPDDKRGFLAAFVGPDQVDATLAKIQ